MIFSPTKDKKVALTFWIGTKDIFSPGFYGNQDYCVIWSTDWKMISPVVSDATKRHQENFPS
jgi:hypothetical protein